MTDRIDQFILRRLAAAEGYLELDMPDHALNELSQIDMTGDLAPAAHFVAGQALMALQDYEAAAQYLQFAAEEFPILQSEDAWDLLAECFAQAGVDELAEVAELAASAVNEIKSVLIKKYGSLDNVEVASMTVFVNTHDDPLLESDRWSFFDED